MHIRFSMILLSGFLSLSAHAGTSTITDKALVLGADVNKNWVRDDVEVYIQKTLPKEVQSRAAMQLARALQSLLAVDAGDRAKSKAVAEEGASAVHCVYSVFPGRPHHFTRRTHQNSSWKGLSTHANGELRTKHSPGRLIKMRVKPALQGGEDVKGPLPKYPTATHASSKMSMSRISSTRFTTERSSL